MKVLILYATRRQSTGEVAHYLGNILKEYNLNVTVADVEEFSGEMDDYDAFMLGTGIYSGMWLQPLIEKMRRSMAVLKKKPVWCWAMCIRVLEEGGEEHAHAYYLPHELLKKIQLRDLRLFAGKLFIADVNFEDRWTLAVRYDGTELPTSYNDDYRDWDAIKRWGQRVAAQMLELEQA